MNDLLLPQLRYAISFVKKIDSRSCNLYISVFKVLEQLVIFVWDIAFFKNAFKMEDNNI